MLHRIIPLTGCLLLLPGAVCGSDLRLTGRLECSGSQQTAELSLPCPAGTEIAFRADDGKLFFFNESDPRKAILADPRVGHEELRIAARPDEDGRLLLLLVNTIKDGRLFLPHYFCAVCNITAYAPGPCWCCQAEFEFREKRVEESEAGKSIP